MQLFEVEDSDNHTVVDCAVKRRRPVQQSAAVEENLLVLDGRSASVEETLASNLKEWNDLPKSLKLGLVEQLSKKISETMGLQVCSRLLVQMLKGYRAISRFHSSWCCREQLATSGDIFGFQEQLDIIHILGVNDESHLPFHVSVSIDDIDSHKLSRVLGYLYNHKATDSVNSGSVAPSNEGGMRRSNSDGNLAKSASTEAQKEHRVNDCFVWLSDGLKDKSAFVSQLLAIILVVVVGYPTPSEGWGHGGRPWSPRSRATPQGLDQRL